MLDNPWSTPALILILGILLGWVADRVVRVRLAAWAATTAWKGDDIILASLRGIVWLWVALVALHVAAKAAPVNDLVQGYASRLGEMLFIASLTLALSRMVTGSFTLYAERLNFRGSATVVPLLVKIVLFTIGALVILQTEGFSIAPVLTALGVGGLAVALALQDTLGNLFAGIHTLVAGQIRPGDFVRLDKDNEGWVIDIGWRNTSVRTMANNVVVVPNKRLGESIVTNFSLPEPHMALRVSVGVAYDCDLEHVERIMKSIGEGIVAAIPGVKLGSTAAVRFGSFDESSVEARLSVTVVDIEAFYLVRHFIIKAIHARFRAEGIQIAFPTRTIQLAGDAQRLAAMPPGGHEQHHDGGADAGATEHD